MTKIEKPINESSIMYIQGVLKKNKIEASPEQAKKLAEVVDRDKNGSLDLTEQGQLETFLNDYISKKLNIRYTSAAELIDEYQKKNELLTFLKTSPFEVGLEVWANVFSDWKSAPHAVPRTDRDLKKLKPEELTPQEKLILKYYENAMFMPSFDRYADRAATALVRYFKENTEPVYLFILYRDGKSFFNSKENVGLIKATLENGKIALSLIETKLSPRY